MDICKKLEFAKNDEANAILEYAKLKNLLPAEHANYIDILEDIIFDEYKHLMEIIAMIEDMKCKVVLTKKEELEVEHKMKEIETVVGI